MDRTGQVLDNKYRLVRLLGEGGMGSVYEAQHAVIGRRCAVKFLHTEMAANQEIVKRFIREAQAASAIGHPNIIDIYDFGVSSDGAPFLVMEFLDGVSLADELEHRRKLPPAEAAEILAQTLSALVVAHAHGVVHRDLKPDNLYLVRAPGLPPRVKILDFGISRVANPLKPEDRMTSTGMVLGTPYYMAPEQARGDRDIDHRLDLYAIGVILYEAVTGQVPFAGDNYNQLLVRILTDKFPAPRQIDPELSEDLEAIILKAMTRDRGRRYQTAQEMLEDMLCLVGDDARARLGQTGEHPVYTPSTRPANPPTAARPEKTKTVAPTPMGRSMDRTAILARRRWVVPAAAAGAVVVAAAVVLLWAPWKTGEGPAAPAAVPVAVEASADAGGGVPAGAIASATTPVPAPEADAGPQAPEAVVDAATVAVVDAATESPPAVAAIDAGSAEESPADADLVTIALRNVPPGAEVLWNGAKMDAVPFRVPRGTEGVPLVVRADGFAEHSSLVTPDKDVTVPLRMRRTGRGARPGADGGTVGAVRTPDASRPSQGDAGLQQGGRGTAIATGFR